MPKDDVEIPWVSFCMSTFRRPLLLKSQLDLILKQSFQNFEIVVSDNDPEKSAEKVISDIGDPRVRYFANFENIGMVRSFNNSIERSRADYVIMITDDDPVVSNMVGDFHNIVQNHPGYSIYMGCSRTGKTAGAIEIFDEQHFLFQILHPALTSNLLWSSCVLRKDVLLKIGGMPDYGSPHLADHLMMALCGTINGGIMINKMFSQLTSHDNNFSKANFDLYYVACKAFYESVSSSVRKELYIKNGENALLKHLERWFIVFIFSLRKYFTYNNDKADIRRQIDVTAQKILQLEFMKSSKSRYALKLLMFNLKKPLYLLNILR